MLVKFTAMSCLACCLLGLRWNVPTGSALPLSLGSWEATLRQTFYSSASSQPRCTSHSLLPGDLSPCFGVSSSGQGALETDLSSSPRDGVQPLNVSTPGLSTEESAGNQSSAGLHPSPFCCQMMPSLLEEVGGVGISAARLWAEQACSIVHVQNS